MHLGMSLGQSLQVSQRLELTLAQRLAITQRVEQRVAHTLTLRLKIMNRLGNTRFSPFAQCPTCNRSLKVKEILKGFRQDPLDFSTECPKCKYRFDPKLINSVGVSGRVEIPFYCSSQTLYQLRELSALSPQELQKANPAVYHSAQCHFGFLQRAFKQIGIDYSHREDVDWRKKLRPFLGRAPDSVIAECVGVSASTVRRTRLKLGIKRHRGS